MGGSDQWGNIINGIDLIRKILNEKTYALPLHLLLIVMVLKWEKLQKELYG